MFIRVKKIKNQNYAYLVNSKYTEKGVRQKIVKYLGKVIELKKNEKKEIKKYSHLTPKQLIHELILLELKNHGFKKNKDIFRWPTSYLFLPTYSNRHNFLGCKWEFERRSECCLRRKSLTWIN